jgi:hypothetical protein
VRYRGLELDDEFVLGYGLHARDLYRNLPFVAVRRSRRRPRPRRLRGQLYGPKNRPGNVASGPVVG